MEAEMEEKWLPESEVETKKAMKAIVRRGVH